MRKVENILIVQTAFLGDAVLTLPLVQVVKEFFAHSAIDVVVTPRAKELLTNHPAISEAFEFDKRGADSGVAGLIRMAGGLRRRKYDLAIVPHRSLRSALLVWLARIPLRIGFNRSAGRFLFTKTVKYVKDSHEIERNLSLLSALGIIERRKELPSLYPSAADGRRVDKLLFDLEVSHPDRLVAIAPGSVWNTKRWPKERFASLAVNLDDAGFEIVLVGGAEDRELCDDIHKLSGSMRVYNTAGMLSFLQSAELIRRCTALVSNDSAPIHVVRSNGSGIRFCSDRAV